MSRMQALDLQSATGETAELFANIKRAVGKVPNAYAGIGSNAPAVLANLLQTNAVLKRVRCRRANWRRSTWQSAKPVAATIAWPRIR